MDENLIVGIFVGIPLFIICPIAVLIGFVIDSNNKRKTDEFAIRNGYVKIQISGSNETMWQKPQAEKVEIGATE